MKDMLKTLINGIMATRTHYDTRKTGKITYTFNGILEGKETIELPGDGTAVFLVKVSSDAPLLEDIMGGTIIFNDGEEVIVDETNFSYYQDDLYMGFGGDVTVVLKDTVMDDNINFTKGIWFICVPEENYHVQSLKYFGRTGELKKLDEKYLPDSVATLDNLDNIENNINNIENNINNIENNIVNTKNNVIDIEINVNAISKNKMDKKNPTGTGSFSLNRKANTTIGDYSFAEGYDTTASAWASHAEGSGTTASGDYSHAEGWYTVASGDSSHAEGYESKAIGGASHAEGSGTTASGGDSHAEGSSTTASGDYSHAEGYFTKALRIFSHAEGFYTLASSDYQHVQGMYNIEDTADKYAHIVGNGSRDDSTGVITRSNAHTLDWSGNAEFQGDVKANACGGENPISLVELYNTIQTLTERIAVLEAALNTDSLTETDANALVEEVFN